MQDQVTEIIDAIVTSPTRLPASPFCFRN